MGSIVFHTQLNAFSREFLVANPSQPTPSPMSFEQKERSVASSIFEQFLLFDTVAFQVYGENIPLAMLMNYLGERRLEKLVDAGAIKFVLWTPLVTFTVTDVPGIDPLQFGTLSSKPHSDPEESIALGFKNEEKGSGLSLCLCYIGRVTSTHCGSFLGQTADTRGGHESH